MADQFVLPERVIVATHPDDCEGLRRKWDVQELPAYLDERGDVFKAAGEEGCSIVLCCWREESELTWFDEIGRNTPGDFLLIHPGAGMTMDERELPGRVHLRESFGTQLFTWSAKGAGGPWRLGEWLTSLASQRKAGNREEFRGRLQILQLSLGDAARDNSSDSEEARVDLAVGQIDKLRKPAGLGRGLPPDPVSVLFHDTIGAIDPFVLDVANLVDGVWTLESFNGYWKGRAAMGLRRLWAWLKGGVGEQSWLDRTGLKGWQPLSSRPACREELERLLREAPVVITLADEGRCDVDQITREIFDNLSAWLKDLTLTLGTLRGAGN